MLRWAHAAFLPFTEFEIDPRSNAAWIGGRDAMRVSQLAFDLAPASLPGIGWGFSCEQSFGCR
jgi:hypothetical protein